MEAQEHVKVPMDPKDQQDVDRFFATGSYRCSKLKPGNWTVREKFSVEEMKNFQIFEDDLWIVTPPKCGTTWMQELAWLIMNDVNLKKAEVNQFFRVPFLELETLMSPERLAKVKDDVCKAAGVPDLYTYPDPEAPRSEETVNLFMFHSFEYTRQMPRPRIIKTHTALSVLPKNLLNTCKVIYVGRNVKDACVSYFHHKVLSGFTGNFQEFAGLFKRGCITYNPLIPHVLEGWKARNHRNLFFTTYEEMSSDLKSVASRLIRFLGKDETSIDLGQLLNAVHIDAFRHNKFVNKEKEIPPDSNGNGFIRKGQVGDWKNYFDDQMNEEWDAWIEEQLRGTDFKMTFEL